MRFINGNDLFDILQRKNNSNKADEQETKVIYSVESMSLFDDLRNIPSADYRRFAMEQKSEGARHINTVAGNHLAKLFDHHCSSWEMVLNPHPFHPSRTSSGPDRLVPRTRAS